MKTNFKRKLLIGGVALVAVLFCAGCGESKDSSTTLQDPTISITSLDIENSGAKVTFNIDAQTYDDRNTTLSVFPLNGSRFYWETADYKYNVELQCNGDYVKCNDITSIVCTRTALGSDYSDYVCDFQVNGITYPQNQKKMRVSTQTESPEGDIEDTLLTVGIASLIVLDSGRDAYDWGEETNTQKMFNVFTGEQGR